MNESTLQSRILARATELGARLFRNNVAQAVAGDITRITRPSTVHVGPGDFIVRNGRVLHAGLAVGSGDLIGWTPTIVHGDPVAVFTSVEVKSKRGQVRTAQHQWRDAVNHAGGAAIIARSVEDYDELVETLR